MELLSYQIAVNTRREERVDSVLNEIKQNVKGILKENLVGVYIHGSIAFKCFNWDKSDIDLIIVVKAIPTSFDKELLVKFFLELSERGPPKGFEMSIVLEKYCQSFIYPTPYELHFSNDHIDKCQSGLSQFCKEMNGVDKDLAAHFTVINAKGIGLYGKSIPEVFSPIPNEYYLDSIKKDIKEAITAIEHNPIYYALNLCRVLAFIEEGLILSKSDASAWGIKHLPIQHHKMLSLAGDCYKSDAVFPIESHKPQLISFATEIQAKIFK